MRLLRGMSHRGIDLPLPGVDHLGGDADERKGEDSVSGG